MILLGLVRTHGTIELKRHICSWQELKWTHVRALGRVDDGLYFFTAEACPHRSVLGSHEAAVIVRYPYAVSTIYKLTHVLSQASWSLGSLIGWDISAIDVNLIVRADRRYANMTNCSHVPVRRVFGMHLFLNLLRVKHLILVKIRNARALYLSTCWIADWTFFVIVFIVKALSLVIIIIRIATRCAIWGSFSRQSLITDSQVSDTSILCIFVIKHVFFLRNSALSPIVRAQRSVSFRFPDCLCEGYLKFFVEITSFILIEKLDVFRWRHIRRQTWLSQLLSFLSIREPGAWGPLRVVVVQKLRSHLSLDIFGS